MRGADMDVRELERMPRLGSLYPKTVVGSFRKRRPALPEGELLVRDVPVDVDRVAAYNRVCGFRLRDELPATYPHVMAFPLTMTLMTDPGFPFPAAGVVHIGSRITQHRPIRLTEHITFGVHAARLRPHRRGTQCDIVAEASVDGEVAWRGESTYLHRHRPAAPAGDSGDSGGAAGNVEEPHPLQAVADLADPIARWRVGADTGRRYARASGDYNPIHQYRLAANVFGFRRAVAHGMWTLGRCLAGLEVRLPAAYTADVTFHRPVFLPSTVEFHAVAVEGGWRTAVTRSGSGDPHLTGTVVWVP